MQKEWSWIARYIAAIFVAVVLAAALGGMKLFVTTTVLDSRLAAAQIVKFLGYGGALVVFWLLGQRATVVLSRQGGRWAFLQHLLLPAVSLIVAASAHSVLLMVLQPIMGQSLRNTYDWAFIALIVGTAGWLVTALFNQSSSLTEAFALATPQRNCAECGAAADETAQFCPQCGVRLGS